MLLNHPETLPPEVRGKNVFYEIGTWCPKVRVTMTKPAPPNQSLRDMGAVGAAMLGTCEELNGSRVILWP